MQFSFPLSSRCFEFWDIEVCCNRNAFTKLSPYIYLKKDTENYIKYIDFSVEVKCPYSWHSNYKQSFFYSPNSSLYTYVYICAYFPERVNLLLPVPPSSTKWMSSLLFFFIPSGVWPISCGHDGHRFQRIPLVYVLQGGVCNTKVHRECFWIFKYPVLTWKLCTFALGEHNNGFPTLFLFFWYSHTWKE